MNELSQMQFMPEVEIGIIVNWCQLGEKTSETSSQQQQQSWARWHMAVISAMQET
jgi:hypothetical protein